MNDSPGDCQNREVTEPQLDGGPRSGGGRVIGLILVGAADESPSVTFGDSSLGEGAEMR